MPRTICPDCDEKVSYSDGKRSAKCPACGTKIELEQPAEEDDREEEEEVRPQKTAKKKVKKKAPKSKPFSGRMSLIVFGPICLGLALWAPFSGYGTALSMVVGTLVMLAGCVVFGIKLYGDPDWQDEASSLLARLVPIVFIVICVRAAMASPRKFAGWGVLTLLGIFTLGMGITANAVWKTMDDRPKNGGPGAQQQGQPGQPPVPKETDDEIINKAIADLDSAKSWDVRGALDRLTKVKPNQRRAEVIQKLHKLIKSEDGSVRLPAVRALGVWGGSDDIPTLTPLLNDKDSGIRGAARDSLGRLRAPVALPLLVEQIGNDHELYPIVAGYGEAAEDALLTGLNTTNIERKWYNDTGWYGAALTVLGNIGTQKSVPTLERLAALSEAGRADPANRALTAIKNRMKK